MPKSHQIVIKSVFVAIGLLIFLSQPASAQKARRPGPTARQQAVEKPAVRTRPSQDLAIVQIIHDVSQQRIQQTIAKLVSFHTRSTLSVNNPDAATSDKGAIAARNWIKSEFERYSAACGGCVEVQTDTFIGQPKPGPRNRIPVPTEIQNVYAILRGADPEQAKRIYLVTGHYDSRNTDVLNSTLEAPRANDDRSGPAAALESA